MGRNFGAAEAGAPVPELGEQSQLAARHHQSAGLTPAHTRSRSSRKRESELGFLRFAQKLFSTVKVLGVSELNLAANQWKEEMRRFDWTPQTGRTHLLYWCYIKMYI